MSMACIAVVSFVPAHVDVVTGSAMAGSVNVVATHVVAAADLMPAAKLMPTDVLPPTQELTHEDGDGGVAQTGKEEAQIDVEEPGGSHDALPSPASSPIGEPAEQ
jgi:hypothetical protein